MRGAHPKSFGNWADGSSVADDLITVRPVHVPLHVVLIAEALTQQHCGFASGEFSFQFEQKKRVVLFLPRAWCEMCRYEKIPRALHVETKIMCSFQ
jgi:hypothetical protein